MRYTRSANDIGLYINNVNCVYTYRQCDDLQIDYKVTRQRNACLGSRHTKGTFIIAAHSSISCFCSAANNVLLTISYAMISLGWSGEFHLD